MWRRAAWAGLVFVALGGIVDVIMAGAFVLPGGRSLCSLQESAEACIVPTAKYVPVCHRSPEDNCGSPSRNGIRPLLVYRDRAAEVLLGMFFENVVSSDYAMGRTGDAEFIRDSCRWVHGNNVCMQPISENVGGGLSSIRENDRIDFLTWGEVIKRSDDVGEYVSSQLERVGFSPFVQLDTSGCCEPQRKNCCGDGGRYSNYLKGGIFSIVSAGLLVLGLKLIYQGIKSSYFNSVPSGLTAIGGAAIVIFLSLFVFFFLLLGIPLP